MKLQASQFAEVFNHLRDHAKPYTQQDAADLAKVRAPMPPTREELNRHKRRALGRVHVDPVRVRPVRPDCDLAEMQRANLKAALAELGGSRTIKPSEEGRKANVEREAGLRFIPPVYNSDAVKAAPVETDQQKLQKEGERLQRLHHTAMLRCKLIPFDLPADLVLSL